MTLLHNLFLTQYKHVYLLLGTTQQGIETFVIGTICETFLHDNISMLLTDQCMFLS